MARRKSFLLRIKKLVRDRTAKSTSRLGKKSTARRNVKQKKYA